ncbi:MAG: hypothetical protein ACXWC6_12145 [Ramlibacter sp.]
MDFVTLVVLSIPLALLLMRLRPASLRLYLAAAMLPSFILLNVHMVLAPNLAFIATSWPAELLPSPRGCCGGCSRAVGRGRRWRRPPAGAGLRRRRQPWQAPATLPPMDDTPDLQQQLLEQAENINALKDNQFALVAQVQVLQATLAAVLLNHPDRAALVTTFERYMKVAKEAAPGLATRMEGLEAGILSLMGKHQA